MLVYGEVLGFYEVENPYREVWGVTNLFGTLFITFLSMISFDGDITLLPMLAALNYSFALWTLDLRLIRLVDVLASLLFLIYDIYLFSVTGFIKHILELFFCLLSIYRFDFRSDKDV